MLKTCPCFRILHFVKLISNKDHERSLILRIVVANVLPAMRERAADRSGRNCLCLLICRMCTLQIAVGHLIKYVILLSEEGTDLWFLLLQAG